MATRPPVRLPGKTPGMSDMENLLKVVSKASGTSGQINPTITAQLSVTGLDNQTGYTCIGIVGVQTNNSAAVAYRYTLDNASSATISVRNIASSAISGVQVTPRFLYIRNEFA